MRSHLNRGKHPVFNHAGQLVSPGAFINVATPAPVEAAAEPAPELVHPVLGVTNTEPQTPEEVDARRRGLDTGLAVAALAFSVAIANGKPEPEAAYEAALAGGADEIDAREFADAVAAGNAEALETIADMKGHPAVAGTVRVGDTADGPTDPQAPLAEVSAAQRVTLDPDNPPAPDGQPAAMVARVTDLEGNPLPVGPDGLIQGDPLNLTEEERANLPPLLPLDVDADSNTLVADRVEVQGQAVEGVDLTTDAAVGPDSQVATEGDNPLTPAVAAEATETTNAGSQPTSEAGTETSATNTTTPAAETEKAKASRATRRR